MFYLSLRTPLPVIANALTRHCELSEAISFCIPSFLCFDHFLITGLLRSLHSLAMTVLLFVIANILSRHCERSEAISFCIPSFLCFDHFPITGLLRANALAMTVLLFVIETDPSRHCSVSEAISFCISSFLCLYTFPITRLLRQFIPRNEEMELRLVMIGTPPQLAMTITIFLAITGNDVSF